VSGEVVARETERRVAAAVAALPEEQRTVVVLSVYQGLSHAEIAAVMEVSEKSVESRLYRARAVLRERLGDLL
jgi:RNA polymerase sigma-70 factor (ECF subfamily)